MNVQRVQVLPGTCEGDQYPRRRPSQPHQIPNPSLTPTLFRLLLLELTEREAEEAHEQFPKPTAERLRSIPL
ncbi:hypothetical protein M408DRAFT_179260 [Serendipita vermifera MAFF 305830]|uniref:Uncharacterized protein n=1 Tax=Serendipita vermifera MAFF 305830 TaxID=933852 RepID=A0A0C2XC20_SERVB|nr:hypothetical protein M408DRAFT_179260 [Serendipita vermifera MAFF 305830]